MNICKDYLKCDIIDECKRKPCEKLKPIINDIRELRSKNKCDLHQAQEYYFKNKIL